MKESPPRQLPRARRVLVNEEFVPVEALINEYVTNLSLTGVFIKSKDPLPVGTRVNLKFSLILEELYVVEAVGEVVRRSEWPLGMGVAFRGLPPDSAQLVNRAVKEGIAQAAKVRLNAAGRRR